MTHLRIGTRASPLALWQANRVQSLLESAGHSVELVKIRTSGDEEARKESTTIPLGPGKGLFTKEIERALLEDRIDLAVHSLKDLAARSPDGLEICAFPEREDPRDALVSSGGVTLAALPEGAKVGTSSLRRRAALLASFPHLEVVPLRGNVDTRIGKVKAGEVTGVILAMAGLTRLDRLDQVSPIEPDLITPAPGQGVLALQTRADDRSVTEVVRTLDQAEVRRQVLAERTVLEELGGDCNVPIGAVTLESGGGHQLLARVFQPDGSRVLEAVCPIDQEDPQKSGRQAAEELLAQGAAEIIESCKIASE